MYRKILDNNNNPILDTLPYRECVNCILETNNNGYANIVCKIDSKNKRIAYHTGKDGKLYLCSDNSKTTQLFKQELNAIIPCIQAYVDISKDISKEPYKRVDRIVHNLKSINAHAIQELESFIPQENIKDIKSITNKIKNKLDDAALLFFKLKKLNIQTKAEFTVYEMLDNNIENYALAKRNYNVEKIFMSVLHPFFNDFHDKGVFVNVGTITEKTPLNFESFQVAIYHLIENATKYVKPDSEIKISFHIEGDYQITYIDMKSIYIEHYEKEKIFTDGYSGNIAKELGLNGKGIGMHIAHRFIELNKGKLEIEAGEKIEKIKGIKYANNRFIISLPLND